MVPAWLDEALVILFRDLILGFFVVGLVVLAMVVVRCLRGTSELARLRSNAERAANGPGDLDQRESILLEGLSPEGLAATRVRELLAMRRLGQAHPDASGLAALVEAEFQRRTLLPRALAGVLVLLGLCGAITGLLTVLPRVSGVISSQAELVGDILKISSIRAEQGDQAAKEATEGLELKRRAVSVAMEEAMAKMTPAFEASITGIVTTILLLLALAGTEGLVDRVVLNPLEEITATRLVPLLTAPNDLSTLQEAVAVLTGTQDHLSELADRMIDQSGQVEAQLSILYSVIHQFELGSKDLAKGHEEIREAHQSTLATVRQFQGLATELARDVQQGSQRGREMVARLDRTMGLLERMQEEGKLNRESAAENLQRALNALLGAQDRQFAELRELVAGRAESEIPEALRRLEARISELRTATDAALAALQAAVVGIGPSVASTVGAALDPLQAAVAGVGPSVAATMVGALKPLQESMAGVGPSVASTVGGALAPLQSAVERLGPSVAASLGQEVRGAMATLASEQGRAMQPLLDELQRLPAALAKAQVAGLEPVLQGLSRVEPPRPGPSRKDRAGEDSRSGGDSYGRSPDGASIVSEGRSRGEVVAAHPVVAEGLHGLGVTEGRAPAALGKAELDRLVTVLERVAQRLDAAAGTPEPTRPASDGLVRVGAAVAGSTLTVTGLLFLVEALTPANLAAGSVVVALTGLLAWWRGRA